MGLVHTSGFRHGGLSGASIDVCCRRSSSSLLIIVLYLVMIFQVVFILANELTSFSLATTTANSTLGAAFGHFLGYSGGQIPIVTNVTAEAGTGGIKYPHCIR